MSEENLGPYVVDRAGWPHGPWDAEPEDKVLWKRPSGIDCMLVRNQAGAWCGYVGVHESHPWFGKADYEVEAEVHGGITYNDFCVGHICHPSEEKTFWIGFDTAHAFDVIPAYAGEGPQLAGSEYRTQAYTRAEVEQLAEQAERAAV